MKERIIGKIVVCLLIGMLLATGCAPKTETDLALIDYDTLPPLVGTYQEKDVDFAQLNKIVKIIKNESVYQPTAQKPEELMRVAKNTMFRFLSVAPQDIPSWANDLVEKEIAKNKEKPDFGVFNKIYARLIQEPKYADLKGPVRQWDLFGFIVDGIIKGLGDPFAAYITPRQYRLNPPTAAGFYKGIGCTFTTSEEGRLQFDVVYKGGPADKAGIKPGDVIMAIDGKDPRGGSDDLRTLYIRDRFGKEISFIVKHPSGKLEELKIKVDSVQQKHLASWPAIDLPEGRGSTEKDLIFNPPLVDREGKEVADIFYIELKEFSLSAIIDLAHILENVDLTEYKGMIIDIRKNPGGFGDPVSDFFLKGNKVLGIDQYPSGIRQKNVEDNFTFAPDIPLVVLIGKESYSACETFGAAMQDNERATLIGERTGGKGTGNRFFEIGRNGEYGAIYLAVVFSLTPNGKYIGRTDINDCESGGIAPDIEIKWSDLDYEHHNRGVINEKGEELFAPTQWDPVMFEAIDVLRGEK
ncbi:MAG: hypothetical protein COT36_00445 [Parcubacteria group bacterium CG08_land_8_20_14_0_20_38_56]|nr:MAG: hypothetical protein COT36_00445 [Parcubacteria group bacterium CG08_land_8_20_14_0_20_38_56]